MRWTKSWVQQLSGNFLWDRRQGRALNTRPETRRKVGLRLSRMESLGMHCAVSIISLSLWSNAMTKATYGQSFTWVYSSRIHSGKRGIAARGRQADKLEAKPSQEERRNRDVKRKIGSQWSTSFSKMALLKLPQTVPPTGGQVIKASSLLARGGRDGCRVFLIQTTTCLNHPETLVK